MSRSARQFLAALSCLLCSVTVLEVEILRTEDLSTPQIHALNRSKTVVLLTGGMLEEHGPYLPAGTDAILSDRLTTDVAQTIQSKKPGGPFCCFREFHLAPVDQTKSAAVTCFQERMPCVPPHFARCSWI
jgi:hypothetical protein